MVLFVNACVRSESRTLCLARTLLEKLGDHEEVRLTELGLKPLDETSLTERTELIGKGDYSDPRFDLAKQFARADTIVIAAPFWDLSFPAILKTYIENIYVTGIVSRYGMDGRPVGLCRAGKLYYVTTAGGPYDGSYSYDYLRRMAVEFFGIRETQLCKAEMLDVQGFDAEQILSDAQREISRL